MLKRWCRTREELTLAPDIVLPPDTEVAVLEVVESPEGPVCVVRLPPYYARRRGEGGETARLMASRLEVLPERRQVCVVVDDRDTHPDDCSCGLCNRNKVSWGAGIYDAADYDVEHGFALAEVLERVYGPSEVTALAQARSRAYRLGWDVVSAEE